MEVVLCSVPVETPGAKLRRKRSEGPLPIQAKYAIASLNNWTEKSGLPSCKFFDIDMLYPSDEFIEKYFIENKPDIVGLSGVVSTSYMQVKRLAKIIKSVNPDTLVVCGGYITAAANTILRKTVVDLCVVGDGEIAWVSIQNLMKENLEKGIRNISFDKLLKIQGIAILDEDKNLQFTGYGKGLSKNDMSFPSYDYMKSGLLGDDEAFQNYFRHFSKSQTYIMDDRAFEKGRKPNVVSIFSSKGCVNKCTFCQRGAKGYKIYDLTQLESHIKMLRDKYDVGFINFPDENFGSVKSYNYQLAELMNKYDMLWSGLGV